MYSVINQYANEVVASIDHDHVSTYLDLTCNLPGRLGEEAYRRRYRQFWVMRGLSAHFYESYFQTLAGAQHNHITFRDALEILHQVPCTQNGSLRVHASFASKLCHMCDPRLPIYDNLVADFFFFERPNYDQNPEGRIVEYERFYQFLVAEYDRVIRMGLLAVAIGVFRAQFPQPGLTDQKVIDSLVWSFVKQLRNGALLNAQVQLL
ncbi:MAG: hypothetical protein ABSA12_07645 [Verrucomicrobiia bacterium]